MLTVSRRCAWFSRGQARGLVHGRPTPVDRWKGLPFGVVSRPGPRIGVRGSRASNRANVPAVTWTAQALFMSKSGPRGPWTDFLSCRTAEFRAPKLPE
jgi:hypothetical protein